MKVGQRRFFSRTGFTLRSLIPLLGFLFGLGLSPAGWAEPTIQVAVAANFLSTAELLGQRYTANQGVKVSFSAASSGKLYAQIRNGLPVDLFLSADSERPALLIEEGLADGASRWTYAIGELSFWAPGVAGDNAACEAWLRSGNYQKLALANPRTAPYGAAAQAILQEMGLEARLQGRLVHGENIAQTFVFVDTGAAEAGFVARSQVVAQTHKRGRLAGCQWQPAASRYPELRQDGVILSQSRDRAEVWQLLDWLQGSEAKAIIRAAGYRLP